MACRCAASTSTCSAGLIDEVKLRSNAMGSAEVRSAYDTYIGALTGGDICDGE